MSLPVLQVVGPGRAGFTIARALAQAGIVQVGEVVARTPPEATAAALGGRPATLATVGIGDWWLLAVPDDALAPVAKSLAERLGKHARLAFHLSGATGAAALEGLAPEFASFHPVRSFPEPLPPAALVDVFVGIGGSLEALATLQSAAAGLAMKPFAVPEGERARYHAACSVASNYPVMLAGFAAGLFTSAGVDTDLAEPLAASLLRQAAVGVAELGPEAALTGPIARGDAGTLARQAAAMPAPLRGKFVDLALATIDFARAGGRIDAATAAALRTAVATGNGNG